MNALFVLFPPFLISAGAWLLDAKLRRGNRQPGARREPPLHPRKVAATGPAFSDICFFARGPPMDLSIVIVNWNTEDLLRDCLQSVAFRSRPA